MVVKRSPGNKADYKIISYDNSFSISFETHHNWSTQLSNAFITSPLENYRDVIMSAMASQISSISIVWSTVCSGADQIKHQSSASLAFARGIHQWPENSHHTEPVTRKMFPFDDVSMTNRMNDALYLRHLHIFWRCYRCITVKSTPGLHPKANILISTCFEQHFLNIYAQYHSLI